MTPFSNNGFSCTEIHTSSLSLPKISNTKTSRNPYIPPEKEIRPVVPEDTKLNRPDTEKIVQTWPSVFKFTNEEILKKNPQYSL